MPDFPYKRLPGRFRGFVRKASLWEGADHILSVSGTRFVEEYRRFYYRDVQTVIVQRVPRAGSMGLWLLLSFLILIVLTFPRIRSSPAGWFIPVSLSLWMLARMIVSLRYSCRCTIQTAVSTEELPALQHTWVADKALARLRQRVVESQGELAPDVIPSVVPVDSQPVFSDPRASSPLSPAGQAGGGVLATLIAFAIFLVHAGFDLTTLYGRLKIPERWTWPIAVAFLASEGLLLAVGLTRMRQQPGLRVLRTLLIAALIFVGVQIWLTTLVYSMAATPTASLFRPSPNFRYWSDVSSAALDVIFAVGGLSLVLLNWNAYRRGIASPI